MYKITLVNGAEEILLHHYSEAPEAPKVSAATGSFELNSVPAVTIDIPIVHKAFNMFQEFISHIKVEDDKGKEIFYGRLITPNESINNGIAKVLIFEGELAYLNDSTIRPREWHDYSVANFLREVLEEHNRQVEDYKKIYLGRVTVEANLYRQADYEITLPFLLDRLPAKLGGYFSLRKVNGVKYLDYLSDIGKFNNQAIMFGENMLDYQTEYDPSGIFTKIIPLGASINDGTEESQVENKLTIESVNEGKDYLINAEAVKKYGVIERTSEWQDVTIASNLKRKGQELLEKSCRPTRSLSLTVADMHELNNKYDKYQLGDEVKIKCTPFQVDEYFKIISMEMDFLDELNNSYTFGNKIGSLTDKQIQMQTTQQRIENYFTEAGLKSSFLDGTINLLSNKMRAMVDSADKHDGTAILFECKVPGDLYGAMAVGTRGFMIADTLKDNGEWDWKTFGTAKGFVATLIIAGKIIGDNLEINLDTGYVKFTKGLLEGPNSSWNLDTGEIKCSQPDGSEIIISPTQGFYNKFGNSKRGYHHLNFSKLIKFPADSLGGFSTVDVQLPSEFKGKTLQISTSVKRLVCDGGSVSNGALNAVDSFVEYNSSTNVAKVYGLLKVVNLDNKQLINMNQYLEVQLEIIA